MKNKTARKLLDILKMLVSSDIETVKLGISLIQDTCIIETLPKEKFEVSTQWRGKNYIHGNPRIEKLTFTKQQFINMLNSKTVPFNKKVSCIFNITYQKISERELCNKKINRYYNRELGDLLWSSNIDSLQSEEIRSVVYHTCGKSNVYLRSYKFIDYIQTKTKNLESEIFTNELKEYDLPIIDNIPRMPIETIIRYKNQLRLNYNQKKKLNIFKVNPNLFIKLTADGRIYLFDKDKKIVI